jgi:hypothetical protein
MEEFKLKNGNESSGGLKQPKNNEEIIAKSLFVKQILKLKRKSEIC